MAWGPGCTASSGHYLLTSSELLLTVPERCPQESLVVSSLATIDSCWPTPISLDSVAWSWGPCLSHSLGLALWDARLWSWQEAPMHSAPLRGTQHSGRWRTLVRTVGHMAGWGGHWLCELRLQGRPEPWVKVGTAAESEWPGLCPLPPSCPHTWPVACLGLNQDGSRR